MQDLKDFLVFGKDYIITRLFSWGRGFERIKDVVVAFLVVKRGKYSTSFLNTSFFILVAAALVGGPIIAENNPFLGSLEQRVGNYQAAVVSYNPYENSLSTVVSVKPRDKVVDYTVAGGDTLASISKRFDVSVDSIKWVNNLKDDTIKAGENLKIPPITGIVYTVMGGDNIYSIAKKYSVDAQNIVNFPFNNFADLDTFALTPGQVLYVPNGVPPEEKPVISGNATMGQLFAPVQAGVKGSSQFIWPTTGIITQYPVWYHMALDIANPAAPPVIAADTGTVIYAGCIRYGYGCHIIIDHGNTFRTLYAHLSHIGVSPGQVVQKGQQIGIMGSTGNSTGTHLHFEIRINDVLQNPLNYLK